MLQRRRTFLLSSAIAACACWLAEDHATAEGSAGASPARPQRWRTLPHTVAQQLNLYRREGLLVAVDAVPGGTKGVQALLGGSADVVVGFYDHSIRNSRPRTSRQVICNDDAVPGQCDHHVSPKFRKDTQDRGFEACRDRRTRFGLTSSPRLRLSSSCGMAWRHRM